MENIVWGFTLCKNISLQSAVFTAAEQTHVDNHTRRTDDRRHENAPLGDITLYVSWLIAKVCILRHLLCDLEQCPWALWAWRVGGSHIVLPEPPLGPYLCLVHQVKLPWRRPPCWSCTGAERRNSLFCAGSRRTVEALTPGALVGWLSQDK